MVSLDLTASMYLMTTTNTTPDTTGYESFWIPVERVRELQERVAKLNKKADKLGVPHVSLIVTDETKENETTVGGRIAALRRSPILSWTSRLVFVKGEAPKLNGWEFISVVLHRPAGNEFVNVQDSTLDLSEFNFTDKHCDHCNKIRTRNATFLVRHEGGQIKQVGSSCLEDYTGVKSPQAHAKHLENIFTMFTELRGGGGWSMGRTGRKFFVTEWLAWVAQQVRTDGRYIGRDMAMDLGLSTSAERAKSNMLTAINNPDAVAPTDDDYNLALAALAYVRTDEAFEKISDFSPEFARQFFAATASDDEVLEENAFNIVAPAIAFYNRHLADQNAVTSEWIGVEKDKVEMTVTVTRSYTGEGTYGFYTAVYMADEQGNVALWYASKDPQMEVGKTYTISGTVKKHDTDRRNNKITKLTRCKVLCEVVL